MISVKGRGRPKALISVLAMLCASVVLHGAPAQAGNPAQERTGHAMGSQIRKHEGGDFGARPKKKAVPSVPGIDVSSHQGNVDWRYWWDRGKRFAYVKATEGTGYTNPYFNQQYTGSYRVGMIRGAYHFALPDRSSGAAQANYFVDNGGGWSPDGRTLPGALDMEYNPYGADCYGLSRAQMTAWIKNFSDTYRHRTGRYPTIYTSHNWWSKCVSGDFSATNPLWIARYNDHIGPLPYDWGFHTFWQYSASPIDQNNFNGSYRGLQRLAKG